MLPCTNGRLREATSARPALACAPHEFLSRETESTLAQLFVREVNFARKLEYLRDRLTVLADFSPLNAFRAIDARMEGHLDRLSLHDFLRVNGHVTTDEQLIAIVRRIDTNADAKISYNDFVEFFLGHDALGPDHPQQWRRSALADFAAQER